MPVILIRVNLAALGLVALSIFGNGSLVGIARAQAVLRGEVVDEADGQALPARVYVQDADGGWHTVRSASPDGSAVEYNKTRAGTPPAVEIHTTLSAHPFVADLPPGEYEITVERGKEYRPLVRKVKLAADAPAETHRFELHRWIDMPARGWYSGETHVHRTVDELPNVMLAEDLNVAFPLVHWVTKAFEPPKGEGRDGVGTITAVNPTLVEVDETHVYWPLNTEYEIFTVNGVRHTLGAVFAINHRRPFERGVPPVTHVAEKTHEEGGLLELDKHNWPWSMAIVPVMGVDLFELSNNHIWRAPFTFRTFGEMPPAYMNAGQDADGMTERGWFDFTFQNYYALINCGFRLRPTAGTASGVHPVPLGFGRVYVSLPDGFSYGAWVRGLDEGRSFVTTGPMLFAEVEGMPPGHHFAQKAGTKQTYRTVATVESPRPILRIEVIVGGEVAHTVERPQPKGTPSGAYVAEIEYPLEVTESTWIAVRTFSERKAGRVSFAHSAPIYIDVEGSTVRPRREEVEYLISRVADEIARSREALPAEAIEEYNAALERFEAVRSIAR